MQEVCCVESAEAANQARLSMSENRELTDEGLYASKSLASLVNVYIPYMP
jgi:hypothetical protein